MKKIVLLLLLGLIGVTKAFTQSQFIQPTKVVTAVKTEKHISSSILLWMRTDKPRQEGMDRWKGPHSKIISANKGLREYRQIHLTETNPGLWPSIEGVETAIPPDRKIDGVADVTLKNIFSLLRGKKQNRHVYKDEVNLFKRTILYASFPKNSRWFDVAESNQKIDARSIIFIRIKPGVKEDDFKTFINEELTPTLANIGVFKELRSKVYEPWKLKQWNTPNVAHDNPEEVQVQASLILGFADKTAMEAFFKGNDVKKLSDRLSVFCSAVHAYEVDETITYIKDGKRLSD